MLGEVAGRGGAPVAPFNWARVGLLPSMCAHMCGQRPTLREALAALVAHVRLVSSMGSFVNLGGGGSKDVMF